MDVPLWLYLSTTFGVALVGVGGVVLSNWFSGKQIDKQLQRDRERSAQEYVDAHNRWIRDQRVAAYGTFIRTLTAMCEDTGTYFFSPKSSTLTIQKIQDLTTVGEDFLFWAGDDVAAEGKRWTGSIRELMGRAVGKSQDRTDPEVQRLFREQQATCDSQRAVVRTAMQAELGISLSGSGPEKPDKTDV